MGNILDPGDTLLADPKHIYFLFAFVFRDRTSLQSMQTGPEFMILS